MALLHHYDFVQCVTLTPLYILYIGTYYLLNIIGAERFVLMDEIAQQFADILDNDPSEELVLDDQDVSWSLYKLLN